MRHRFSLAGWLLLALLLVWWRVSKDQTVGILLLVAAIIALLLTVLWRLLHRGLIRVRDKYTESPLERALAKELSRQGIPFRREYAIGRVHVDFALPEHKLAVECDGWRYHKDRREKDLARDRFLANRGWTIIRFTGGEIRSDARGCVRRIREEIRKVSG